MRDVGRGAARAVDERVVASVSARQVGAGDVDGLGGAHILGQQAGEDAAAADQQAVTADEVIGRARDAGRRGAVIDAVDAAVGGAERLRRDVDADARSAANAVVGGVGAGEREAVHSDCLAIAHVLVGDAAGGDARDRHVDGDHVATDDVAAVGHQRHARGHGDGDHAGAVIDAVSGRHVGQAADGDGLGRDAAGGGVGGVAERVIAGV